MYQNRNSGSGALCSRLTRAWLLIATLCLGNGALAADSRNLPQLGDRTSAIISLEDEHALGQEFLRTLRAQAPTITDPLLQEYLELLIYKLALNSQLTDRRLDVIIIDADSINAFAAPGGIVGVNDGLFVYAETEDEIAAILSHELAHLSQRHFARRSEVGKQASITSLAGFIAGIALIAAGGGDAGIAAMSMGQAATQSQMLSFSRSFEAEADRVGIETLANAGKDPRAMAFMFERLERSNRFSGAQVPGFLMTHPVTRERIADSYNQVQQFPRQVYPLNIDYQLMRARVIAYTAESFTDAALRMERAMKDADPIKRAAAQYGLVVALTETGETDRAMVQLRRLQAEYPDKIALTIAEAEIHVRAERYDEALGILGDALKLSPGNYPISSAYADTLLKAGKPQAAEKVLVALTTKRPNDVDVWYQLAETYGLANNIIGVHQARAEYFVLVGNYRQAITQLGYALPLVDDNYQQTARIRARIEEINGMRLRREENS